MALTIVRVLREGGRNLSVQWRCRVGGINGRYLKEWVAVYKYTTHGRHRCLGCALAKELGNPPQVAYGTERDGRGSIEKRLATGSVYMEGMLKPERQFAQAVTAREVGGARAEST